MGVVAGATAANAWMMQPLMDKVFVERDETLLMLIPAAVIALALIKGFAGYAQSVWMTTIGQRIVADIQLTLFARLMRADLAYFHANPAGTLISRFVNDAGLLRGCATNIMAGIGKEAVTAVFLVALMFYQDWLLATIASIAFPIAFRPMQRIGKRMRRVSAQHPGRDRPVHDLAQPDLPGRALRQSLWHGSL